MTNLSIKDVPDAWAEKLRNRAARNHRSLQGELMAIIEHAVNERSVIKGDTAAPAIRLQTGTSEQGGVAGHDRHGHRAETRGWKTIEQVAAELRSKYPEPPGNAPLGIDIIRADRDSR